MGERLILVKVPKRKPALPPKRILSTNFPVSQSCSIFDSFATFRTPVSSSSFSILKYSSWLNAGCPNHANKSSKAAGLKCLVIFVIPNLELLPFQRRYFSISNPNEQGG